jgi:hypothetical protein
VNPQPRPPSRPPRTDRAETEAVVTEDKTGVLDERIDAQRCWHGDGQEHDVECLRW